MAKTFITTLTISNRPELWASVADIINWLRESGQEHMAMELTRLFTSRTAEETE